VRSEFLILVMLDVRELGTVFVCLRIGGLKGNVHGSSMDRWKAHGRLPISVN